MVTKALLLLFYGGLTFSLMIIFELGNPQPATTVFDRQLKTSVAISVNDGKTTSGRFHDVLRRSGFQFARTASQFILEAAYASHDNQESSLVYNQTDVKTIIRALNVMRGFMNMGLWSGSNADTHFIGTASCMTKLKRPAIEVAAAVLHGIYVQEWTGHVAINRERECDQRHRLRQVLGSELERKLWLSTGLYGNGPWSTCSMTYLKLFEKAEKSQELIRFLQDLPMHLLLCDEVDEGMGGDGILSGHWKRRSTSNFDDLFHLAEKIGERETLGVWVEANRAMTHTILHPEPGNYFMELTPPNSTILFDTVDLNPNADPEDISRWFETVDILHAEQGLVSPYLSAMGHRAILERISDARALCDRFASSSIAVTEYLDEFQAMKDKLSKCEDGDVRFHEAIPLPEYPPEWALTS